MTGPAVPLPVHSRREFIFPTLTPVQMRRVAELGRMHAITSGKSDVRGGNVKRVASAVGEGSIAISFAHRVLNE